MHHTPPRPSSATLFTMSSRLQTDSDSDSDSIISPNPDQPSLFAVLGRAYRTPGRHAGDEDSIPALGRSYRTPLHPANISDEDVISEPYHAPPPAPSISDEEVIFALGEPYHAPPPAPNIIAELNVHAYPIYSDTSAPGRPGPSSGNNHVHDLATSLSSMSLTSDSPLPQPTCRPLESKVLPSRTPARNRHDHDYQNSEPTSQQGYWSRNKKWVVYDGTSTLIS